MTIGLILSVVCLILLIMFAIFIVGWNHGWSDCEEFNNCGKANTKYLDNMLHEEDKI